MKTEYDFSKGERGKFSHESAKLDIPTTNEKSDWTDTTGRLGKVHDE